MFASTFSPCKTVHRLELVIGRPTEVSSENKTFRELLTGSKETMFICMQIEMLKICAMLGEKVVEKVPFFPQLVEKFEYRLIARSFVFENCVSKLSFDPIEKSEFACKYTMLSKALWQTIYLMKNAALGLNNLLTECFRNNERNFCSLSDGFLAR